MAFAYSAVICIALFPERGNKVGNSGFELHAVAVGFVADCIFDTFQREIGGYRCGIVFAPAAKQRAAEGGGEHIAGAVAALRQTAVAVIFCFSVFGDDNAGGRRLEGNAGKYHG